MFYVWGIGAAGSDMVRSAVSADEWPIEADAVVSADEGWCVLVEADEDDLDAVTRFDAAVRGYCKVRPCE